MPLISKEQKFYDALRDVFIGHKIEGQSGYINLMKLKSRYFENIFNQLSEEVNAALKPFPKFKSEFFDKLFDFFSRYFSETGSIYFKHTPFHQNIYDKVYTDDKDVILFWKTHMLYYVKSDKLFKNLEAEIGGFKFFFDVKRLEHKKSNEKRKIIYEFDRLENQILHFIVLYSERGKKTKIYDIIKILKKEKIEINEEILIKAFSIFEKQSEVDYFINKNSKEFLEDQFDLWLFQYMFKELSDWNPERIKQIQMLKQFAIKIINFISQFENELVKIWNKPKFVLKSNYVITLNKIKQIDEKLFDKILTHQNFLQQLDEWKELNIVKNDFNVQKDEIKYLPVDTKFFKDLELAIIGLFENISQELDGWLIKSENYQALKTILPKFQGKVQTIYLDPPFNTGTNEFPYKTNFLDSSWISMLHDRLVLGKDLLNDKGSIFFKIDYHGNHYVRYLMDSIFGTENFKNEIIINRTKAKQIIDNKFQIQNESLFFYTKNKVNVFNTVERSIEPKWYSLLHFPRPDKRSRTVLNRVFYPPKGRRWALSQDRLDTLEEKGKIRINQKSNYTDCNGELITGMPEILYDSEILGNIWLDIPGYAQKEHFATENSEKLLERIISSSSNKGDLILDYFLGSGTTIATAHKLGRKWIGIEMAEHFYSIILPRMKRVLAGEKGGISKDIAWKGGGFFKYYELEQYDDTLQRSHYENSQKENHLTGDFSSQYVFLRDLKLLDALEINQESDLVTLNFNKLYDSIDIVETISNIRGKSIKNIKSNQIIFEDGEKLKIDDLNYSIVKPLIWW